MDTRRDAGEFYPGGKVISTRPLASGGDVKHSDFEDLDVKTNTIPDLREAVRELGRRLGATVVTALAACVATAATVQTVPVNDLDFDANPSVVTNVVFDAPPDFSASNAALVATIEATAPAPGNYAAVSNAAVHAAITNALQDAAIAGKASTADATLRSAGIAWTFTRDPSTPGHYYVVGQSGLEFWLLYEEPDGVVVDSAPYDADALSVTFSTADVIAMRPALRGYQLGSQSDELLASEAEAEALRNGKQDNLPYPTNAIPYAAISGKPSLATVATSGSYNDLSNKPTIPTVPTNVSAFNNDAGYLTGYTETDPTISAWAKAPTKPTYTASEIGAYSTNETMYVDWIGDIGCIYGDYTPSGVWDFGDGCLRLANRYQFNVHMTAGRQSDGIEIFDTSDPTIKTVIPINGSDVATIADIDAAISPTSPTFSNAVLSVGLGIDTNTVAVINELVDSAHDLPVSGATSVGALLLALAAAVAALKGNKADKPTNPTNGNLVKVSGAGELQDAGYHFEVRNGVPCIVQYA